MINVEERNDLNLFRFIFLVTLLNPIIIKISGIRNISLGSPFFVLAMLYLLLSMLFIIGFFVLLYKSASILRKYNQVRISAVVWLLMAFIPIVGTITSLYLFFKTDSLLMRQEEIREKQKLQVFRKIVIRILIIVLVLLFYHNLKYSLFKGKPYYAPTKHKKIRLLEKVLSKVTEDKIGRVSVAEFNVYNNLGIEFSAIGEPDKALEVYKKALKISKNMEGIAHYGIGVSYMDKKDFTGAIKEFDEAIQLNDKLYDAYQSKAVTYRLMGDFEKSVEACKKTIELFPNIPETAKSYCSLGWAYEKLGNFEDAANCHIEAIRRAPKWEFPRKKLVFCLSKLKYPDKKLRLLEEVNKVDKALAASLRKVINN